MASVDYMELMSVFASGAPIDQKQVVDWIKSQKAAIDNIASIVQQIPTFKDSQETYRDFILGLDEIGDLEERLKAVWYHILNRAIEAPTTTHLRGVVIMCMPALKYVLDRIIAVERELDHAR